MKNIILSNLLKEHPQVTQSTTYIYIYIYRYKHTRLVMLSTLPPLQSMPLQTRTLPTHNVSFCTNFIFHFLLHNDLMWPRAQGILLDLNSAFHSSRTVKVIPPALARKQFSHVIPFIHASRFQRIGK